MLAGFSVMLSLYAKSIIERVIKSMLACSNSRRVRGCSDSDRSTSISTACKGR
jgi:hypothetical protein